MDAAPKPDGEGKIAPAKNELPTVESPPLSPVGEAGAPIKAEAVAEAPVPEPIATASTIELPLAGATIEHAELPPKIWPRFVIRPRHKRYGILAASVTFAAALGAVIGALASGGLAAPPVQSDVATIAQTKTTQQSIARLNKEIAALKANIEQANKSAHTQIAKLSDRLEHQAADVTGSISSPQTVPVAQPLSGPVPLPRPAQRVAAVESLPGRIPVVPDWTIHDYRHGYIFVQGHGEVFQVQIGASLPGLGPVQAVKRQDGHWVVLTPRGMIVSMSDRRYFEEY